MSKGGARPSDLKGGPGHTVVVAVAFALPVMKAAYLIGGPEHVWQFFATVGADHVLAILGTTVLDSAWLAAAAAVVLSRMVYAAGAARGAVGRTTGASGVLRTVALTAVNPITMGVLMALFFGTWWGVATGAAAFVMRQGIVAEYRTGRRGSGASADGNGAPWLRRFAAAEHVVAALLAIVVLPLLAVAATLDGRSWAPVLECTVDTGGGPHRARVIELEREASGVVGWDLAAAEVANGVACGEGGSRQIRTPWWDE